MPNDFLKAVQMVPLADEEQSRSILSASTSQIFFAALSRTIVLPHPPTMVEMS